MIRPEILILILLATLATQFSRLLPFLLAGKAEKLLKPAIYRWLELVPFSVVAVLLVNEILFVGEQIRINPLENPFLIATVVAALAVWYSKNILVGVIVGCLTFSLQTNLF